MNPRDRPGPTALILLATLLASSCGPWRTRQTFTEVRPGIATRPDRRPIARSKKPKPEVKVATPKPYPDPRVDVPMVEPD